MKNTNKLFYYHHNSAADPDSDCPSRWDQEKQSLKGRIDELESQLYAAQQEIARLKQAQAHASWEDVELPLLKLMFDLSRDFSVEELANEFEVTPDWMASCLEKWAQKGLVVDKGSATGFAISVEGRKYVLNQLA